MIGPFVRASLHLAPRSRPQSRGIPTTSSHSREVSMQSRSRCWATGLLIRPTVQIILLEVTNRDSGRNVRPNGTNQPRLRPVPFESCVTPEGSGRAMLTGYICTITNVSRVEYPGLSSKDVYSCVCHVTIAHMDNSNVLPHQSINPSRLCTAHPVISYSDQRIGQLYSSIYH